MNNDILLIDDDAKLRRLLKLYLEEYEFRLISLPSGARALETVQERSPCLVILDVTLPCRSGLEVLCQIRSKSTVPIIMLTARGEHTDRILGLEFGADDYLTKPFNPRELLARIRAILRRSEEDCGRTEKNDGKDILEAGGLLLHTACKRVLVDGVELELAPAEFHLLRVLMKTPDVPISRDDLMEQVWGKCFFDYDRSIDVYISKLRAILRMHAGQENRIQTVRGIGYMFVGTA